mmetsp:Transcript_20697/g.18847  ORF Transcript_20697/g.18847 Transcript_20697/m.18847 type:complete len:737 (+) Transcript_20697:44-2254(+)
MTTKLTKKKSLLANVEKNRESFQEKFKELQADMEIGRGNMEKINRGLKGNDINQAMISEIETEYNTVGSPKVKKIAKRGSNNTSGSQYNVLSRANTLTGNQFNTTESPNNQSKEKEKSFFGNTLNVTFSNHNVNSDSASTSHTTNHTAGSMLQTVLAPSNMRVSDWCFTGSIESSPPTVKSAEMYEFVRWLGRGSFGDVQLAKNSSENKLYAMKTIFSEHEKEMQKSLREVVFLRIYRHPCIIDIHDAFLTQQPKILHIVMPYCEGGDMGKLIATNRKNGVSINEHQIMKWSLQLALALHFLHEHQTLHRDLKPSNVMLTDGGETIKLADFGLTIALEHNVCEKATEAGTPLYTAPEMINGEKYSYPTDCWAFGVMLYEMMRLEPPFHKGDTTELVKSILSDPPPELPTHYSHELRLISKLFLSKNPNHRLGFAAMLMDPFFNSKTSAFPNNYRPKAIEERIRRTHIKQLQAQLESIPYSKLSSLTPISELNKLIAIAEQEALEQAAAAALAAQAQLDANNEEIVSNSFRRPELLKKGSNHFQVHRISSANSVSSVDKDREKDVIDTTANNDNIDSLHTISEGHENATSPIHSKLSEIQLTTSHVVNINTAVIEETLDKLQQIYPLDNKKRSPSSLFKSNRPRGVSSDSTNSLKSISEVKASSSSDLNDTANVQSNSESSKSTGSYEVVVSNEINQLELLDKPSSSHGGRKGLALQEALKTDSLIEESINSMKSTT